VAQANRYEPKLTESALDFARHYGCSMLPARAYHPQDKAKVELSVQLVERWILARLRKQRFASVNEVNEAIAPLMTYLNERAFQKLPGCRASAFAQINAPALMALPTQPWEWAVFKTVRVHVDSHVEFEGHRYSAPQRTGRASAGVACDGPHGRDAAPGPARGQPHALCAQRGIYHRSRALARAPPSACAVDARAAGVVG
jgi:hypothetical protein